MRFFLMISSFFVIFFVSAADDSRKLRIVTSLFPLYDFCREIGGDKVTVSMLLPPGVEAHSFSPTPQDVSLINSADLFIYLSDCMEPWMGDFRKNVLSRVVVLEAGRGMATLTKTEHLHCDDGCKSHNHDSSTLGKDPHVWLDFGNAVKMVDLIAVAMSKISPSNRDFFLMRAKSYDSRLMELDARTRRELSKCKLHTIISGGHFAFGYYAKRYGLRNVSPYVGFSPDAEPSPSSMAMLIETLRSQRQSTIFCEELLNDRVASIISDETGATISLLHAAHNLTKEEFERGDTFISIMNGNLERLTSALREPSDSLSRKSSKRNVGMIVLTAIIAIVALSIGALFFSKRRT